MRPLYRITESPVNIIVGSVVEWLRAPGLLSTWSQFKTYSHHSLNVLGKDTLRHFFLLSVFASSSKSQSYLYKKTEKPKSKNFNQTAGRGNCLPYKQCCRRFPASQEDKYRDGMK